MKSYQLSAFSYQQLVAESAIEDHFGTAMLKAES
jgi:hypothetical protein